VVFYVHTFKKKLKNGCKRKWHKHHQFWDFSVFCITAVAILYFNT